MVLGDSGPSLIMDLCIVESQGASKYEEQNESVQHGWFLLQSILFNHCYSTELDPRGLFAVIDLESSCPVAAGAAGIKDQPGLAALLVGFTVVAGVELALVGRICIDAVGLASTESTPTSATSIATRAPAATSTSTPTPTSTSTSTCSTRSCSHQRIGLSWGHTA